MTIPLPERKTKIIATIGPATSEPEVIASLIENGMNVARLNFSHGEHSWHSMILQRIRDEARRIGKHVAVIQDLCGPKMRINPVENDEIELQAGQSISLSFSAQGIGDKNTLYLDVFDPKEVIKPGEKALLADGRIVLVAKEVSDTGVRFDIRSGGLLRSRSGISLPETKIPLPCITEKDLFDLAWGVKENIDFVALSFVGSARDIQRLRAEMTKLGASIPIIAKIERAGSIDHIDEIVGAADAVMVARGDLGLELPLEVVPGTQRHIIEISNNRGTPVITATQMLQSMVHQARPTRAEVTDVYSAVRDGTDAVMLSEETAVGEHPVQAVHMLDRILLQSEKELLYLPPRQNLTRSGSDVVADAICFAACSATDKVNARGIISCTASGRTARLIAKYRPKPPIFGVTTEQATLAQLALVWGIEPVLIQLEGEEADEIGTALRVVRDRFGIKPGSRVILTSGKRARKSGTTTLMEIREVPRGF